MWFNVWRHGRTDHHSMAGGGIWYSFYKTSGKRAHGQLVVLNRVWVTNPFVFRATKGDVIAGWTCDQVDLLQNYFKHSELAARARAIMDVIVKNEGRSERAYREFLEIDMYIARNTKREGYDCVIYCNEDGTPEKLQLI